MILNSTANSGFKSSDGIVKVPFRFNIDDIHSQARSSFVSDLPPSLNSRNDKRKWAEIRKGESEADYNVTYSITASAFSKKGVEASTEKTIQVLPVSQTEGPRSPSDCPGEYFFAPLNVSIAMDERVSEPRRGGSPNPRYRSHVIQDIH